MKISSVFKPLSFLPALALMYMIYSFSSQPAESSSSISYKVSYKIVQAVDVVSQQNWEDWQKEQHAHQIHGIVRKGAHITEYFLLAIAVSFPLYVYGVRGILLMLLAGVICVGYACADEYHQSMVAGRSASARDVLIDSIGIFFGVILVRLIGWSGRMAITGPVYERRQKKQQKELDAREEALRKREEALRREEMRYRRERYTGQWQHYGGQAGPKSDNPYADLGNGGRPAQPQAEHGNGGRPARPQAEQVNGGRPARPQAEQGNGRRPARPQADLGNGGRPARPQAEHGNGGRPARPQAEQGNVGRPARPQAEQGNGGRPARPQAEQGNVGRPAQPYADRQHAGLAETAQEDPHGRTRVLGTRQEIDDRTRVYRTEEEKRRMEEAYRRQVYERRKVQSRELQEDSTSDQLSEDLPFSGLFRKKK